MTWYDCPHICAFAYISNLHTRETKPRMTPQQNFSTVNGTTAGHEAQNPARYLMMMMMMLLLLLLMMMMILVFSLVEFNFQYIIRAYRVTRAFLCVNKNFVFHVACLTSDALTTGHTHTYMLCQQLPCMFICILLSLHIYLFIHLFINSFTQDLFHKRVSGSDYNSSI